MKNYDHKKIESKWQKEWEKKKIYQAKDGKGKKFYSLIEFPYPSGAGLHVGHPRPYIGMDIISRKRRMEGYNVLFPIGWDAFGLPTENYAIKMGIHPSVATRKNIDTFRRQLKSFGPSFDWSREIDTTDPSYYKWTQWIFLQMFKKGLAYKSKATINWCPSCKIGLANEEVVAGECERCGTTVIKKEKEQWMLAITKYADRLDKDLDDVDYLERIKIGQKNWIGKSEGSEIEFKIANPKTKRFILIHGKSASPRDLFFPWLKDKLEDQGFEVIIPELPNPENPNDEEQAQYILKNYTLDENTVIVGHSMGGIVAMRLLERGVKVHGVVLLASVATGNFLDKVSRPTVKKAAIRGFNFNKIIKQAEYFTVIIDKNDKIVPKEDGEFLAKNLKTECISVDAKKGHFLSSEEPEILSFLIPNIKIFTTRADTIFGATYVVLAPEHPLVERFITRVTNQNEVKKYIDTVKKKSEMDRTAENKEKTGVELKGVKVINPANNEEIPVWIADYVLPQYGTGAVMAVPAHDERDFEFAKKYNLSIKKVIEPIFVAGINKDAPFLERNAISAVIKHWSEDKYLCLKWKKANWITFVTGGVEKGQTPEQAACAEILEETGFFNMDLIKTLPNSHSKFYHIPKKENRFAHFSNFYFKLKNGEQKEIINEEKEKHEVIWLKPEEIEKLITPEGQKYDFNIVNGREYAYINEGILTNSGKFDNLSSEEARKEITEAVGGKLVTKFKLRDWIFSRQRYWGEPIPIINCDKCGYVPVPEKDLPVVLPKVKSYKPTDTGESPLANISKWVNVKCPKCSGKAKRETDTMPNWAGSSWYYLRYTDPKNKKEFASQKMLKYWTPVDWYHGGMEHTTLHLLYSRFWHKFLYDMKLVPTKEPYMKRTAHGMILAENGEKMSKSKGNVINPDKIIKLYGADTLRLYEMFIGPFEQTAIWNTSSIIGPRRFLEKVWRIGQKIITNYELLITNENPNQSFVTLLHKTIKKVTEDIESMSFNTAVSAMMVLVNEMEKQEYIDKEDFKIFLQLLAPFAPHIAEELYQQLLITNYELQIKKTKNKKQKTNTSIHLSSWPKYDSNKIIDNKIKIAIQVNGKLRGEMTIERELLEDKVKQLALYEKAIIPWIEGRDIKRVIYVPNRLINIVI